MVRTPYGNPCPASGQRISRAADWLAEAGPGYYELTLAATDIQRVADELHRRGVAVAYVGNIGIEIGGG